jgi:hypothetical protein
MPGGSAKRAADAGDFKGVSQAAANIVRFWERMNLGLILQPPECCRENDSVEVTLEGIAL